MKIIFIFALLVLIVFHNLLQAQKIISLSGIEDAAGKTHLFYRIEISKDSSYSNSIYHFIPSAGTDTLFLYSGYTPQYRNLVYSFLFLNNDPNKFLFSGSTFYTEEYGYIKRYDGASSHFLRKPVSILQRSYQKDSLIFASLLGLELIKSDNGGLTFQYPGIMFPMNSVYKYNDSIMFGYDQIKRRLVKSLNSGITHTIVDTTSCDFNQEFFYDKDMTHIYRIIKKDDTFRLMVSDSKGDAFSWQLRFSSNYKICIDLDNTVSGKIYLSAGKKIFISTNFGNSFSEFKTLENNISGIYKKHGTDILYVSTSYNIYEISGGSVMKIKYVTPDKSLFEFYPLEIGNKWIYEKTSVSYPWPEKNSYISRFSREVIKDTLINGENYFVIYNSEYYPPQYEFERIDMQSGKIYRLLKSSNQIYDSIIVIDDLLAEKGDTFKTGRFQGGSYMTIFTNEFNSERFGKNTLVRSYYYPESLAWDAYLLVKGFGVDSAHSTWDFGNTWVVLKGFIRNGFVYGDTSLSDIKDNRTNKKMSYVLYQNYPNPFNPKTKINYELGVASPVTLKIYDLLGREVETFSLDSPINNRESGGVSSFEWDGSKYPGGIYFYELKAGDFRAVKKMVLLK